MRLFAIVSLASGLALFAVDDLAQDAEHGSTMASVLVDDAAMRGVVVYIASSR